MMVLNQHVHSSGLNHPLLELIRIRVSQMNGCAYCINLHVTAARALGVSEQQLDLLVVWQDAPCFGSRERAALQWVEALTSLPLGTVPDVVYEHACEHFTTAEIAELSIATAEINAWNRLMKAACTPTKEKAR